MFKEYFMLQDEAGDKGGGPSFNEQEIAQRLASPDGAFDEIDKDNIVPDETLEEKLARETAAASKVDNASVDFVADPMWDVLKKDEGFTMPENLTSENEKELLKTTIAKKYGIEVPVLHPLAKQIQEMSTTNPNLTINDLVNTVSEQFVDASKMTADEKISFDLYARYGVYDAEKNPDGLTDDDIKEHIAKLTKIEKQEAAKVIEQNINEYNKKLTDQYKEQNQQKFEQQYESIVTQTKEAVSKLKIELSKVETIFGIPVSQEQHSQWLSEFERVVTPDKTTGERGIDKILSNDILLYKMFVLLAKQGEDKVIEEMTKGRENAKAELLKKFEITPTFTGSNARDYTTSKEPNYEEAAKLLSIPEM